MLNTRLEGYPSGSPVACLWQGQLLVAWVDSDRGDAIGLAVGDAVTAGQYAPSISQPGIVSGDGAIALTTFLGRVYLGWRDVAAGTLFVAYSTDATTFSAPIAVGATAQAGLTLHGDEQLYASWIQPGSRRTVIATSVDGLSFLPPVVLNQEVDFPPALTTFDHPFHGHRLVMVSSFDTALYFSSSPATNIGGLDASPVKLFGGDSAPSVCFSGPPFNETPGPTIAMSMDDTLALLSVDIDGAHFSGVTKGPYADGDPAVVAVDGDLLIAYRVLEDFTRHLYVGSWAEVFGIPDDMRDKVGKRCDPSQCTDDPRLVCVRTGEIDLVQRPAEVSNGRRGDLVLTPADGDGVIGTILKSLDPHQFYDHMGILTSDGGEIRHCTESKSRVIDDESYYTGTLLGDPAPTDGLRPDLVKYGWPGPMTQTVQDGFFDGWNKGLNPEWSYREAPDLLQTQEQKDAFFDPEHRETPVRISNLTYTPTYRTDHPGPIWPLLVRPPRDVAARLPWVRWALNRVADAAIDTRGHYSFYAYSEAIAASARLAPPPGDAEWNGLPSGADWPAGRPGLVCSTFIWFAVRKAFGSMSPAVLLDHDPGKPQDGTNRTQNLLVPVDGLYAYHADERTASGIALHDWIVAKVRGVVKRRADAQLDGLTRVGIGAAAGAVAGAPWGLLGATLSPSDAEQLVEGLTDMAEQVANGVCNAFVSDTPANTHGTDWKTPGGGLSVSPDDILNYWDSPTLTGDLRAGLWGDSERLMLVNPRPEMVDVGRLALSPGIAHVTGLVGYRGEPMVGAKVAIGCRTSYTDIEGRFVLDVPSSPEGTAPDQLVRAQAYWYSPPGMVSAKLRVNLPVGLCNLGDIELEPPPEWRRRVELHGELRMHHQVMFGHDTSNQGPWSSSTFVQSDPAMAATHYATYAAALTQSFAGGTERCGGERATFSGQVSLYDAFPPPGAPPTTPPPDGPLAVTIDWRFAMFDGKDGDEEEIVTDTGQFTVPPGESRILDISLKDADLPPDRAYATITVDNTTNPA